MGTTYISVSATNYVVHTLAALIAGATIGFGTAIVMSQAKGTNVPSELLLQQVKNNKQ